MNILIETGLAICELCDTFTSHTTCIECNEDQCFDCLTAYGCDMI